jgi:hypothetical protein
MTATLAVPLDSPPTAVDIDRLAIKFLELEQKVDEAYKIATELDEPHEKFKEQLIDLVDEFGSMHADKSKLLHGLEYEILGTFGVTTSIDAAAVERFAQGLRIAKQTKLLNQILEQTVRYALNPEASSIIRSSSLPKQLLQLFAACQVTKARSPVLRVRRIVSEG